MINVEEIRIKEVNRFLQIDFDKNSEFQALVDLAAKLCGTPVATMTLLTEDHNHLAVRYGVDFKVMPRETSFCQHTLKQEGLFIIPDATKDSRFSQNPLVMADPNIRFYAGAPLILNNGVKLGSLCLFDIKPNDLTEIQKSVLDLLSRQAVSFMELELNKKELNRQIEEKEQKNQSLIKIAQLQSHQIRQPLTTIMGLANLVKEGYHEADEEWIRLFEIATGNFDTIIQNIVAETIGEKDLKAIRFHKMVEEIDDCAILLLDKEGHIENWNKGAKKIKGYSFREIVGKHFSVFYTEYDKKNQRPQRLLAEAERNGIARDEGWRVRKSGENFWGSIVITAIHDQNHQVIGFTKLTRDLTDITDLRESLTASDALYKHLLTQTNKVARVGGWELDLIKNEVSWTTVTKEIHGVDADYVPNLDSAINFYKKGYNRNKIKEIITLAIAEGKPWDTELQIINKQGKEIWVRATGESNFKEGICTKVYGTFQDIDASKRSEINALDSGRLHREVLGAITGIAIIATDLDGIVTLFNPEAEKMLGYKADEVIGKLAFSQFFRPTEPHQTEKTAIAKSFFEKMPLAGLERQECILRGEGNISKKFLLNMSTMNNKIGKNSGHIYAYTMLP